MTRAEMMNQLGITDDSPYTEVQEKLFLIAILPEGTEVTERILGRHITYRELFWSRIEEAGI